MPVAAAYCPSCGAPRSEIDRILLDAARVARKAFDAGAAVVDRAVLELQPAFHKAVQAIEPAVQEVERAFKPFADTAVRGARDVVKRMSPTAEKTAKAA